MTTNRKGSPVAAWRQLISALRRLENWLHREDDREAIKAAEAELEGIRRRLEALGIRSAAVCWMLAIAKDRQGRLLEAFDLIEEAVSLDPGATAIAHSRDVIVHRIRCELVRDGRDLSDPAIPRLWEVLARCGEADEEVHLVMARHLLVTGKHAEAQSMAKAVTTLFPSSAAGWELMAEIAVATGDSATAAAAIAEAAARGHEAVPFMLVEPGEA